MKDHHTLGTPDGVALASCAMNEERGRAVDEYFTRALHHAEPALDAALAASAEAGLAPHQVSPAQGKLLMLLALMQRAKNILEIGTRGGYGTIWLAKGLSENGRLVTLEADPKRAELARSNIAHADLLDLVDIRVGRALDTLPKLIDETPRYFDMIFIGADEASYPDYLAWALRLSRRGTVIIADNVVRNGTVTDATTEDRDVVGVRRFVDLLAAETRVSATAIQTVGTKGWDGFAIGIVVANP
jgi:predicted O-methyltransferase YrrM